MIWSARTRAFLCGILGRAKFERDMQAELRFHIESYADDLVRQGMSREEALRRARIELGAVEAHKEECRASLGLRLWDEVRADLRYSLRGLVKSSGFAITAVLTLAIGIGATTTIFSVVNALLIRPLPYRDPDQLVWITEQRPKMGDAPMLPDAVAWNQRSGLLESVAAYDDQPYTLTGVGEAVRVSAAQVTPNFLATLGVRVQGGRDLGSPGEAREALISDGFWHRRFSANPRVVGSILNLDGKPYTIVGVLPQDFRFPDMALSPEVLTPLPTGPEIANPRMGINFVRVIGRTRIANADLRGVQSELQSVHADQLRTYDPWLMEFSKGLVVGVTPLQVQLVGDARQPLLILFAAIGAVLLIACANIANLQLVRTTARSHEIAVRSALGASRVRLARQFMTESLTVALMAGAVDFSLLFCSFAAFAD
jgi:putative ABC transport system permease protein